MGIPFTVLLIVSPLLIRLFAVTADGGNVVSSLDILKLMFNSIQESGDKESLNLIQYLYFSLNITVDNIPLHPCSSRRKFGVKLVVVLYDCVSLVVPKAATIWLPITMLRNDVT